MNGEKPESRSRRGLGRRPRATPPPPFADPATSIFHRILCPQPCKIQADMSEFPKKELETLWAPWRVEYFEKEPRDLNFLSAAAQASDDAAHLVITLRKNAFLMMNRYPYAVGHLMAVPYRKAAELSALGENEIVELWN